MPGETTQQTSESSPDTQHALNHLANGTHLKQKTRRARSQLSCIPCRAGKLKCNRGQACDQCIKRLRDSSCVYLPPPAKQKPANVKGRIRQLESLVVDLMNQQRPSDSPDNTARREKDGSSTIDSEGRSVSFSQPTPPSDNDSSPHRTSPSGDGQDDVEGATRPFGQMRISRDSISYVGSTHWQAILNGISELKRDLSDDEEPEGEAIEQDLYGNAAYDLHGSAWSNVPLNELPNAAMGGPEPHSNTGLGFMLGNTPAVSREQLIASVPEKKVADRLLSLWFNSPDPFKPIIHAPTFQDEYRRFWRNPKETPTMWLGLLYSILSIAASFGLRDKEPSSPSAKAILASVNKYHTFAASAAVLADFTKPKQYTIECLILYSAGLRSNDAFVNVWLMIGLVIRLALRMGYHRDPGGYPAISTFHGEMRRRVWALISMIDVLISFQLGLPSMVKTILSDTQPPRNLLDRDFNVDTKILPPGRGVDELTPCSYARAKLGLTRVFADASEMSHATMAPTHEEVMALDRQLEEAKDAVPPLLQMADISELVTDPAEILMCRFNLDLMYLKTKIVLHRRYMEKPFAQLTAHEQQMGIGQSRKACIQCSLRVLRHHHTIYSASQPGGQLESVRWYMGSLSTHDFLLSAMVICLELSQQISGDAAVNPGGRLCPQRAAMMDALEKSQKIWSEASGRKRKLVQLVARDELNKGEHLYDETEKAGKAMAVMLQKVKETFPQQARALAQFGAEEPTTTTAYDIGEMAGIPTPMYTSAGENVRNFGGVVSYHQWGNMNGVPEGIDLSGVPSLSTNSNSNDSSSNQDTMADFSMIGDIIDMPVNIDWEMFDQGLHNKGAPTFTNGMPSGEDLLMQNTDAYNDNVRAGNALIGGGTGVVGNGTQAFPGSWMLEDVNLDMGNLDGFGGEQNSFGMDDSTALKVGDSWRDWEI